MTVGHLTYTQRVASTEVKPQHWAKRWWREESFWKDVTTRTLAILIAGLVVFLVGILLGYVSRPDVWPTVLLISFITFVASVAGFITWRYRRRTGRHDRTQTALGRRRPRLVTQRPAFRAPAEEAASQSHAATAMSRAAHPAPPR